MLRCQDLKGIKEPFRTMTVDGVDYICITDIARQKNAADPNGVVGNWLSSILVCGKPFITLVLPPSN